MAHPLVEQLRFTRSEFRRGLDGLREDEACKRFMPMNCISWNVGHLASQEQQYFLYYAQGELLMPELKERYAFGAPACTPALQEVKEAWDKVTQAADPWLDTLTTEMLQQQVVRHGRPRPYLVGSLLQRVIYHYWYHNGENLAIRQMLGHSDLPIFVGNIDEEAPFRAG